MFELQKQWDIKNNQTKNKWLNFQQVNKHKEELKTENNQSNLSCWFTANVVQKTWAKFILLCTSLTYKLEILRMA